MPGSTAADVRHINAHGTSTPLNDAAEAEAIAKVFGAPGPIVTSTKGVTGHALGAAGAIEAVAVLLSMQHRLIPPTAGTTAVDPELAPIDLVLGEPRPWEPGGTLSNSFGFGGHNGTLVLGPAPPADSESRRTTQASTMTKNSSASQASSPSTSARPAALAGPGRQSGHLEGRARARSPGST